MTGTRQRGAGAGGGRDGPGGAFVDRRRRAAKLEVGFAVDVGRFDVRSGRSTHGTACRTATPTGKHTNKQTNKQTNNQPLPVGRRSARMAQVGPSLGSCCSGQTAQCCLKPSLRQWAGCGKALLPAVLFAHSQCSAAPGRAVACCVLWGVMVCYRPSGCDDARMSRSAGNASWLCMSTTSPTATDRHCNAFTIGCNVSALHQPLV